MILGDVPGVTAELAGGLAERGIAACVVRPGDRTAVEDDGIEVAFDDGSLNQRLPKLVRSRYGMPVGGVISLLGCMEDFRGADLPPSAAVTQVTVGIFRILQACLEDLSTATAHGSPRLINVTMLDGAFGLLPKHDAPLSLTAAATIGLMKACRAEIPGCVATCIDLSPDFHPEDAVEKLLEEFEIDAGRVEIGFSPGRRWQLSLVKQFLPAAQIGCAANQDSLAQAGEVWLVTGGADGITAAVARSLAQRKCRLVIVGRSSLTSDGESIKQLDEAGLRQHFLAQMKSAGERPIPATIELRVQSVLKNRRIQRHLDEFRACGTDVEYISCDVRDQLAFADVINGIYDRYGSLDGVVHGAGVILDAKLANKSIASFKTVLETKVNSALTLANTLRPEGLKCLAFFSSTSARFGNRGQTDYSAANEFLNKLANRLNREWPGRVVALNWGPWDSGMVSEQLRDAYAKLGIELIPPARGVALFEDELAGGREEPSEVVLSASINRIEALVSDLGMKVRK